MQRKSPILAELGSRVRATLCLASLVLVLVGRCRRYTHMYTRNHKRATVRTYSAHIAIRATAARAGAAGRYGIFQYSGEFSLHLNLVNAHNSRDGNAVATVHGPTPRQTQTCAAQRFVAHKPYVVALL